MAVTRSTPERKLRRSPANRAVAAASATAMSTFVQHMRALPDNLERAHGLAPEVVEAISKSVDDALSALADDLKELADLGKK